MASGATDFVVVQFDGASVDPQVIAELGALVESGVIRIRDLLIVRREGEEEEAVLEISDLDDVAQALWDGVVEDIEGLLATPDGEAFGRQLPPNSSALAVLYENTWAGRISDAVRAGGGVLLFHERIPRAVIEELEALQAQVDAPDAVEAEAGEQA